MAGCGKPVILCMMTGSAVDLQYADSHVNAILQTWYPGGRGGRAVADLLFGACSPSGKLPVTFYRDLENFPAFEDYSMKGRTYRYLEKEPLYPFGYGLTYGDVSVKEAKLCGEPRPGEDFSIKVLAENEGSRATDDVLQVYIRPEESRYAAPNHSLCAFGRIHLQPGEKKETTLRIPARALTIVDQEGKRYVDGKKFSLYVGTGQPDERSRELMGHPCVKLSVIL